jgi:enoyl-CoA hydratase/carnithine racemase
VTDHVDLAIGDGVAVITLDRPEKLNAFTDAMLERWIALLDQCRTDGAVRVIVMTGTGRAFTTGGDVESFADAASQTPLRIKARLTEGVQRLPRKLAEIDKPVIAALNGIATGGGLDIALACDLRFAAESAWLLPRLIGMPRALDMFWTCDWVEAPEALRIGLVDKVFPDAELLGRTLAYARRVAEGAPLSVQTIKRVIRAGIDKDLATGLELIASNMALVRSSEDHKEALAAFKEKRKPLFKGR